MNICKMLLFTSIVSAFTRDGVDQCTLVPSIAFNEQCQYILDHCNNEQHQIGAINYLSLYYCTFHYKYLGELAATPMVTLLGLFFVALGLTASEYLCPNLYTIAKLLNLSDNVAGLTLLAMGNASPDVLSTYKAMQLGSGSLALSQLMGAALFITTVIIGTMALIHPFHVPRSLFIRDSTFFLVVAIILFGSLWDSILTVTNSVVLIAAYIIYVAVVVSSHSIRKMRAENRLRVDRARSNFSQQLSDVALDTFPIPLNAEIPGEEDEDEDEDYQVHSGKYGLKLLLQELSKHSAVYQHFKGPPKRNNLTVGKYPIFKPYSDTGISTHADSLRPVDELNNLAVVLRQNSEIEEDQDEEQDEGQDEGQDEEERMLEERLVEEEMEIPNSPANALIALFAPQLADFYDQDLSSKFYNVISLPIALLLRVTNPVRDHILIDLLKQKQKTLLRQPSQASTEFDFAQDKLLLCIQTALGINFVFSNVFESAANYWSVAFPIGLVFSAIATALVHFNYTIRNGDVRVHDIWKLQVINYAQSGLGFVVSISWISVFATETISILKTFALIYDLSDDILGVTVFAVGNSIGDFISNYTIAKMGMPIMAFGACFGGPLLAICLMGLSTLIIMRDKGSGYRIEKTPTITITSIALVLNIAMLLLLVSRNNWMIDRKIGVILIFNWVAATTLCLVYEGISK